MPRLSFGLKQLQPDQDLELPLTARPRPQLFACGVGLGLEEPLRSTGRLPRVFSHGILTLQPCSSTPLYPRSPCCTVISYCSSFHLQGLHFGERGLEGWESLALDRPAAPTFHRVSSCSVLIGLWVWCHPVHHGIVVILGFHAMHVHGWFGVDTSRCSVV